MTVRPSVSPIEILVRRALAHFEQVGGPDGTGRSAGRSVVRARPRGVGTRPRVTGLGAHGRARRPADGRSGTLGAIVAADMVTGNLTSELTGPLRYRLIGRTLEPAGRSGGRRGPSRVGRRASPRRGRIVRCRPVSSAQVPGRGAPADARADRPPRAVVRRPAGARPREPRSPAPRGHRWSARRPRQVCPFAGPPSPEVPSAGQHARRTGHRCAVPRRAPRAPPPRWTASRRR